MRLYLLDSSTHQDSPFRRPGVLDRIAPFLAIYVLSMLALLLQRPLVHAEFALLAIGVFVLAAACVAGLPWHRLPPWMDLLPPTMMFAFTALVRHAYGGTESPLGVLLLLPVFWLALYGTMPQLMTGIFLLGATLVAPVFLVGAPMYGPADLLRAELWLLAAGLLGVAMHQLVAEVRWHARQWELRAHTDQLTGLPNRSAVESVLERELSRHDRSGAPLAVAFLDLDRFKDFNDAHGHHAGDDLLAAAAGAWSGQLRAADVLGRMGGEEFVVVFPETDVEAAVETLERLRLATPKGQDFSAGVARARPGDTPLGLLARADERLYEAKRSGRGRTVSGTRPSLPVAASPRLVATVIDLGDAPSGVPAVEGPSVRGEPGVPDARQPRRVELP